MGGSWENDMSRGYGCSIFQRAVEMVSSNVFYRCIELYSFFPDTRRAEIGPAGQQLQCFGVADERRVNMFTIRDILELAVQIERNGQSFFRDALEKDIDPEFAAVLQWMAEEESGHIEWFERLKNTVPVSTQESQMEKMGREVLGNILGNQRFSLSDMDLKQIKDIDMLVEKLIEFENDTVLFYEMIKTAVNDKNTVKHLDMIIAEEKQHSQKLRAFIEKKRLA
jgi:rubrerythrin